MNATLIQDFIKAFVQYIEERLRQDGVAAEYIQEAVEIVDAHNHIFRFAGNQRTAEEENIFALSDLLRVNPDTLDTEINIQRLERIAHNYFH